MRAARQTAKRVGDERDAPERPAGEPEALRAWFYPGREWGEEFVYPKSRALILAKETHTAVLYTDAPIEPEIAVAIKTPDEPVVVELKRAPVMAVQPTGGIDLDRNKMQMNVHKKDNGVQMTFDKGLVERIKRDGFDGLEFTIQSIKPVANLPACSR